VLVVAHLRFGPRAEPQPDRGVREDDPAELREQFEQADKTESSNQNSK
jgi:hypothetical protein